MRPLLIVLLGLCTSTIALPMSAQYQVDQISQVIPAKVDSLLNGAQSAPLKPSQILVVFDDDNTLETTDKFNGHHQYLGSVAWSNWQSQMIKDKTKSKQKIASSDSAFYADENYVFDMISMVPTETGIPAMINKIENEHVPVIVETARSGSMLNATEAELARANMHFSLSQNLDDATLDFTPKGGREVILQHGIMLVAGQNKGTMLQDLFQQMAKYYPNYTPPKVIIFSDDTNQNDVDVFNAFENTTTQVYTYTDNHMLPYVQAFNKRDKRKATKQWRKLLRALHREIPHAMP